MHDALNGFRIRRSGHMDRADLDERTASRDLKALVDRNLLVARGETLGRHYIAGPRFTELKAILRKELPFKIEDPNPGMRAELVRRAG